MRVFFLATIALLVLGGGAAGVYFYFGHPAEAAIGPGKAHQEAGPAHDRGHAADHSFVQLDPLLLPIIDETGVNQIVSISIVVEVSDDEKAKKVETLAPRLKDAYIQELYGVLNKHAALRGGVVQVGSIKERLRQISQSVMGDGIVEDVLLQVVQQRKI